MEKRGQVTMFVIVAIVVIVAVGAGVYFSKFGVKGKLDTSYFQSADIAPLVNNIQDSVTDCMTETSKDALVVIGIQGGYYDEPTEYFDLGWAFVPYYYKEGNFLMPSNSQIETELGKYVDENLNYCLDEMSFSGFKFDYDDSVTSASIRKGEVSFSIDMPLNIIKDNRRMILELSDNPVSVRSKLYEVLEVASYITESHREDPEMVCISCVADMAEERQLYVDMLDFDEETTTLIVISENSTSEEPYIFEFLNKYPPIVEE